MYDSTPIEDALASALELILPAGTILLAAGMDGARPTGSTYATYLILEDGPAGLRAWEQTSEPDPADPSLHLMDQSEYRRVRLELQTYGPAAYSVLNRAVSLYQHPVYTARIFELGVSINGNETPTRIPAELISETEDRWTVVLLASYLRITRVGAPTVQTIDPDPNLTGG